MFEAMKPDFGHHTHFLDSALIGFFMVGVLFVNFYDSQHGSGVIYKNLFPNERQSPASACRVRASDSNEPSSCLGSFKVIQIGTNDKSMCDLILVTNDNLGRSSHRFQNNTS